VLGTAVAVLTGRIIPSFDGALVGLTPVAFEKKLLVFPSAKSAD
jgi:hypothetical protein